MFPGFDPVGFQRTLDGIGLPAPRSARPLSQTALGRTWLLSFGPDARAPSMVLRASLVDLGVGGPCAARAALRMAHLMSDLPVPRELVLVPTAGGGVSLTLESHLPGRSGAALAGDAQAAARALEEQGRVMASLEDAGGWRFGTRANAAGDFLPRAPDWRGEVEALLEGMAGRIAATGVGLGPRLDRLLERARSGLDAASLAYSWALVHGDLHVGNLLFEGEDLALSGVVDWDRAMLGDPLLEWGAALQLPRPALARVLVGYGVERARERLEAEALDRLDLYLRLRCLTQLATAGASVFGQRQGLPRALALEQALTYLDQALEPNPAERALSEALESTARPLSPRPRPAGHRVLRRQALEALRWSERVGTDEAAALLGALAASELASAMVDPAEVDRALAAGLRLIPALNQESSPLPGRPVADRAAWRASVLHRARSRPASPPCLALAALALGLRAIDALDGAVSDHVLRGLEALVEGLAVLEASSRSSGALPPHLSAAHAWLGALALHALGEEQTPSGRAQIASLAESAEGAWDLLRPSGSEPAGASEPAIAPLEPLLTLALAWKVAPPGVALAPLEAHRILWPGAPQPAV